MVPTAAVGGGVTAAVAAGVEIRLIAKHGNWRSDAIFVYVSDSLKAKLSVSASITSRAGRRKQS
jgi:hypothetical protein